MTGSAGPRPTPERLSELALFGGVPLDELRAFAEAAAVIGVPAGDDAFCEGDEAREIYVVAAGELGVYKRKADGAEHRLALLSEGEFFGEMGLIDMQPRAATVRAEVGCVLWRWDQIAMRNIQQKNLKAFTLLVMNIARELARRLRRADDVIVAGG